MKRNASAQRAVAAAALIAALLSGGYAAWWYHLEAAARQGIEDWAQARRADGWQVAYGGVETAGFPFALEVRVLGPHVADGASFDWQGPDVLAVVPPHAPDSVKLHLPGRHEVALRDGRGGATRLVVDAGHLEGSLALDGGGGLDTLLVLGRDIAAGLPGAPPATVAEVRAAVDDRDGAKDHMTASLIVSAAAEGINLPAAMKPVIGNHIAAASLRARVMGEVPGGSTASALERWRDAGGTVEVEEAVVRWSPLSLTANGTLALDRDLQPVGALTAQVRGFFEALDQMTMAGVVRAKDASMAKLLLGMMARQPAGGGPPTLDVPLTVQDRVFYVGPAALARLPAIAWHGRTPPADPAPAAEPALTPDARR